MTSVPPQRIPRPDGARPGEPSPWGALPAHRRAHLTLEAVLEALVPTLAPVDPPSEGRVLAGPGSGRPSAVLVALFEEGGETRVILTRRSATMRSHSGQVSFPGGRIDSGESVGEAALREAFEEVALDPAGVKLLGGLAPLSTMSSAATITPVVGILDERPSLWASPSEVELVFDVALADLMASGVHRSEEWGEEATGLVMHFYHLPADIVWGATARILTDLLGRITGAEQRWPGGRAEFR